MKKLTTPLSLVAGVAIGFFLFKSDQVITKTEYVKGATISDTITKLVPYEVRTPSDAVLPHRIDTVYVEGKETAIKKVDTLQIIENYIKENRYKVTLFDNDTLGFLSVEPILRYNALQSISYRFTPIVKTVTIEKKKTLQYFASSSVNTFGFVGIGGGLYYKSVGGELKYLTDFNRKGVEIGVYFKF